ncbi:TetR/AcrR family transcriptional regulator [Massilia norwichensis]|uniref:TetR/AcrR family transcriptional regulator n=1 Tax=Massilia norwichensis TaxID=1442366 RepID=A0ABT2A4N1_9BURK|nr:TetR/AcrR family transcriptional regulator [Massilia norwichensis]MCS0589160.1 TetR/AcrR family transcriptional regulator [Massilia norwichensis]
MSREPSPARTYRGVSQDERRAQRRSQLIGAAIQVYGERGYRQATVKAVCEAAGLTERYFYESFANSEDLLIQSYNAVTFSVFGELRKAAQAAGPDRMQRSRAMLRAYFTALRDDPRSARVFLVEIRGVSRAVDKAFDASLRAIGDELAQMSGPENEEADPLLLAGVVGGVIHIALRWIEDGYSPDIDSVTESAMRLVMVAPRNAAA